MDRDSYSLSDDVNQSTTPQPTPDPSHPGQPSDNGAVSMSSTSSDPASPNSDIVSQETSPSEAQPVLGDNEQPQPQKPNAKNAEVLDQSPEENFWVELVKIIIYSALLTVGIRWFVVEARYIPTESMLPTLEVNDRLIVEKMSYRFREPERGDIVVFRPTDGILKRDPSFRDALIKRIVGMPGETVEVRDDGTVYISNEAMDIPEDAVELNPSQELDESLEQEPWVFFNNEPLIETYITSGDSEKPFSAPEAWGPVTIPEDSYLVLGDNRRNSYDSRYWRFVRRDNLIGRAAVRFWPFDRFGSLNEEPLYYLDDDFGGDSE